MFRTPLIGVALAAVVVSGCERITDRATPERLAELRSFGVATKTEQRNARRLEKALARGQKTGDLSGDFGDLQGDQGADLPALLNAAMERNARIGAAAQNINLADARRLNAIFGYLPQVRMILDQSDVQQTVVETDNAVFQQGDAQYPVSTQQLRIEQPIFDLARIFGIQYAGNARSLAEVEYIRTLRDVAYEVFDAYAVAGQSRSRSVMMRRRMALISKQINGHAALDQSGLGDLVQITSLQSERASVASEEALASADYIDALGALSRLTGTTVTEVPQLSLPDGVLGSETKITAEDAVKVGLVENPLIMAAALNATGSELERRAALAEDFAPVLMAYASMRGEDRADSRFGGGSVTQDTTIGFTLTVPLFNAAGEGYATLPSSVQSRAAVLEYHNQRRALETNIRATHGRLGELNTAVRQASRSLNTATRAMQLEQSRFDTGQSAEIAVVARQLRQAEAREWQAYYRAEYLRAWARLQYLMGADLSREQS